MKHESRGNEFDGANSTDDLMGLPRVASQPTTNAAPPKQGWTAFLLFCNWTVILGGSFMFGYNLAVVNGPYGLMSQFFNESYMRQGKNLTNEDLNTQFSFAVTLYLIGGTVGSTWFPGFMAGRLGKRYAMMIGAIIGAIGEVIIFISPYTGSYAPFMVGRAVVGFQSGLAMVIGPGLINEHAPAPLRGACGTLFGVGLALGLIFANLLGLPFILGQDGIWHFLFIVALGLYIIHGVLLFFIVESPRWLLDKGRANESLQALMRVRKAKASEVGVEFEEMKQAAEEESKVKEATIQEVFRDRKLWWPLLLTVVIHINNELTGLSAVLIYTTIVLRSSGLEPTIAACANFGISFGVLAGNIISALLVERVGRRNLMLAGTMGIVVFNVYLVIVLTVGASQASIAGFVCFLIIFSAGPGPIPWYMPAEMFNQAVRPMGLSVGMFTNWVGNIIVTFVFPVMQMHINYYSFLPFAVIALLCFFFFLFFLPETGAQLADYSPEIFAPGKSLLQLRQPKKRQTAATAQNTDTRA